MTNKCSLPARRCKTIYNGYHFKFESSMPRDSYMTMQTVLLEHPLANLRYIILPQSNQIEASFRWKQILRVEFSSIFDQRSELTSILSSRTLVISMPSRPPAHEPWILAADWAAWASSSSVGTYGGLNTIISTTFFSLRDRGSTSDATTGSKVIY